MMKTLPLSEAIVLQRGFDLPTPERRSGRYPVVTSTGMATTHNEFKVKGPGVVIGRSGSIGGGQYITDDFWPLNTTLWVKDFKGNNEKFIYYLLKSLDFSSFNAGAAVPTLNRNHLSALKVAIPVRATQDKIADVLGTIDEKIELNRKMNETLEQMGQALFRHYFIDNPQARGWEEGAVSDLINIYSGFAFKSADFNQDGEYGLVTIKNVQDGTFISACTDHLGDPLPAKTPDYAHLSSGDIILSLTGNVGRVCLVVGDKYLLNQRVAKLAGKNGHQAYAYFLFRSTEMKEKMSGISRGTAQMNLSPIETKKLKIKTPPSHILVEFNQVAGKLVEKMVANNEEVLRLTELRDTMLPQLISGKVKA
ncbi:restriction endonuclease subunit S [Candidatus Saccharibacteria bacterium]|nr:restriction endonuclease subunit S [Candidatus Saccharibacteria bacterium]